MASAYSTYDERSDEAQKHETFKVGELVVVRPRDFVRPFTLDQMMTMARLRKQGVVVYRVNHVSDRWVQLDHDDRRNIHARCLVAAPSGSVQTEPRDYIVTYDAMCSDHSVWLPRWGKIPAEARRNVYALADYCYKNPDVLEPPEVLATVCQFLLPRVYFPHTLKNYFALMEYIGLGNDANIDEIQSDPLKALRVIVNFGTCPSTMWGASDPGSACCDWPGELPEVRLLAKVIAKRAANE